MELTVIAIPNRTRELTGTCQGLAHQEPAGWVFGQVCNHTYQCLRSKPLPLAVYTYPLLTLAYMCISNLATSWPRVWLEIHLTSVSASISIVIQIHPPCLYRKDLEVHLQPSMIAESSQSLSSHIPSFHVHLKTHKMIASNFAST